MADTISLKDSDRRLTTGTNLHYLEIQPGSPNKTEIEKKLSLYQTYKKKFTFCIIDKNMQNFILTLNTQCRIDSYLNRWEFRIQKLKSTIAGFFFIPVSSL